MAEDPPTATAEIPSASETPTLTAHPVVVATDASEGPERAPPPPPPRLPSEGPPPGDAAYGEFFDFMWGDVLVVVLTPTVRSHAHGGARVWTRLWQGNGLLL